MNIQDLSFPEIMAIVRRNPNRDKVLYVLNQMSPNTCFIWVKKDKVKPHYKRRDRIKYSTKKILSYV